MVDPAVVLSTPPAVELKLRNNREDEELGGVETPTEDNPEVYHELPVGIIEWCVLVLDLLWLRVI